MKRFLLFILFTTATNSYAAKQSFNEGFIGTWKGKAPTKNLCSGGRDKIHLKIINPEFKSGENYKVTLLADWGCFSEMKILGFIFADEFWGASEDRMTFVKLKLVKSKIVSGEFRFDLNGQTLEMNFSDLKKSHL